MKRTALAVQREKTENNRKQTQEDNLARSPLAREIIFLSACPFHCPPLNRIDFSSPFLSRRQSLTSSVLFWCALQLIQLTVLYATRSLTGTSVSLSIVSFSASISPDLSTPISNDIAAESCELLNRIWRVRIRTPMYTHCAGPPLGDFICTNRR
jgi:hypothetical protein